MAGRGRHNHACEIETSLALALEPSLVRMDRLTPSVSAAPLDPLTDAPTARVDLPRRFEDWTHNGALGDPTRADPELGRRIHEVAHERALAFAKSFAELPV
jgi:creatinine amidohydrolase